MTRRLEKSTGLCSGSYYGAKGRHGIPEVPEVAATTLTCPKSIRHRQRKGIEECIRLA